MLIVGWGKGAKKLGYLGMMKCRNCNKTSHFYLYELANNIKLYFISVVKYNKEYIVGCTSCESGFKVEPEKKDEILNLCKRIPPEAGFARIWNRLDQKIAELADKRNSIGESLIDEAVNHVRIAFSEIYSDEQIMYVMQQYFRHANDDQ